MDPLNIMTAGSALSGMVGSALTYAGGRQANIANIREARRQESFQERLVGRQEKFQTTNIGRQEQFGREMVGRREAYQERMSNTAYQRAMQDMRSAGINPILAYSQGGASTPTGGSASIGAATGSRAQGSKAKIENIISPAVNSAVNMTRSLAEIQNIRTQTRLTENKIDWFNIDKWVAAASKGVATAGGLAFLLRKIIGLP